MTGWIRRAGVVCTAFCLGVGVAPLTASAQAVTQLQRSVAHDLVQYGYRVDPRALSTRQLAALHMLMREHERYHVKRMKIRTILSWEQDR